MKPSRPKPECRSHRGPALFPTTKKSRQYKQWHVNCLQRTTSLTALPVCQNETVKRIAQKVGKNPGQVLLRWGLQHGCAVLPTSENAERIKVRGQPFSSSL